MEHQSKKVNVIVSLYHVCQCAKLEQIHDMDRYIQCFWHDFTAQWIHATFLVEAIAFMPPIHTGIMCKLRWRQWYHEVEQ